MIISEGFIPKRMKNDRLPPGQYEEAGFPVLSLGPTPDIVTDEWRLEVTGKPLNLVKKPMTWNWEEFNKLPKTQVKKDIHCVTKWSKFDTNWEGVSIDDIVAVVGIDLATVTHLIAYSYDGYSTNLPIEDVIGGGAMVATAYAGEPIDPEHGGPARLLVPHLYFWKSAKWINKIVFTDHDEPGFWETRGYHNYGDPWKAERYWND
jgi:DMSO/TMAO reductase YedYZ molybdopterin-dependent catalytic subunit